MQIIEVHTRKHLKQFIRLSYDFYHDDPNWVAPLRSEYKIQFDKKKNPFLEHTDYQLFLLEDQGRVIGRIAAFIDTLAVDFWKESVGLFGYYECIENEKASSLLLHAAEEWLKSKGMTSMRGPWSFVSEEWGMVIEGFEPPPVIMAPYNHKYYPEQIESFGLSKVKDLLCYYISAKEGYKIPDRILSHTDKVADRYKVRVRKMDMKKFNDEVQTILGITNQSLLNNWGYTPVTDAEAKAMAKDLKRVIQPSGVLFAEDETGEAIGFILAIPDLNVLLKGLNGRLLPFGWIKLLYGMKRLRSHRLFGLAVIPEYHGKGIDSLIYRKLYETLYTSDMWMEINYVLEDNFPMNNAISKLAAKPLRRYRIYEKRL